MCVYASEKPCQAREHGYSVRQAHGPDASDARTVCTPVPSLAITPSAYVTTSLFANAERAIESAWNGDKGYRKSSANLSFVTLPNRRIGLVPCTQIDEYHSRMVHVNQERSEEQ